MKVKELKAKLADLSDDAEVLAENKISGNEMSFEFLMGTYIYDGNIIFYQL